MFPEEFLRICDHYDRIHEKNEGTYIPTLEEIEEAKLEIQATWSPKTFEDRCMAPSSVPVDLHPMSIAAPDRRNYRKAPPT